MNAPRPLPPPLANTQQIPESVPLYSRRLKRTSKTRRKGMAHHSLNFTSPCRNSRTRHRRDTALQLCRLHIARTVNIALVRRDTGTLALHVIKTPSQPRCSCLRQPPSMGKSGRNTSSSRAHCLSLRHLLSDSRYLWSRCWSWPAPVGPPVSRWPWVAS